MKTSNVVLIAVLFLVIGILISIWYVKATGVYYKLPKEGSTAVWGPYYWKALSTTVEKIPCGLCRGEAIEMISAMHDVVNFKLEKKLYSEENLRKWLDKYAEIKTKLDAENGSAHN